MEMKNIRIEAWIEKLQSYGKHAFSIEMIKMELPHYTAIAVKRALARLVAKGKILSVYKGYYLIIPPRYASKGILPPTMFLEAFMHYLERPYYLGLLNAAAIHGAAHQQPQEFSVITTFPSLRPTLRKGLKINYFIKKSLPAFMIEQRKTESGYLQISNPLLTATDLIQYEKRVGGMSRVTTVLYELMESIDPSDFSSAFLEFTPMSAVQRLGYLFEFSCTNSVLSDALFEQIMKSGKPLFRIPLTTSCNIKGYSSTNRWKVVANTVIDIEL